MYPGYSGEGECIETGEHFHLHFVSLIWSMARGGSPKYQLALFYSSIALKS